MERFRVGNIEIAALSDGTEAWPASDVYPEAGEGLDAYRHYLSDDGLLTMNFGSFLLRDGQTTILVDTGWGTTVGGYLPSELEEAGVAPGEVDVVVFTHLHGDHTGWNMDAETGKPRFANARYLVPGADWAYYSKQQPHPESFVHDVQPLMAAGVMELFDGEHSLTGSVTAIPTPGHTPGHTSIIVTSAGEQGCILGDVVVSPIDAEELTWANSFDWDNDVARATRLRMVERLISDGAMVGASHLPAPGIGRFIRTGARTQWQGFSPSEREG